MRAAVLRELGGVPEVGEFAEPDPPDGCEVVEVTTAGLNPIDLFIATGNMPVLRPQTPFVPGLEGVGVRASDGARVYFGAAAPPNGAFGERTAAATASIVEVPDGVDDGTALCFGIAGMAGWISLEWRAKLEPGESVVVLGASGMVGRIAVQAAKLLGAGRVVAAARNEEALAELAELGADATVPITEEGFTEALQAASPDGIDLILDPVWGPAAMAALDAGSPEVRLIQVGNASGPSATLAAPPFRNRHASIVGHSNFHVPADVKSAAFRRMCEHAAAGELHVDYEEIPLTDISSAWERQAASPGHKLVLTI
ncbi:MAG: zinc-binding alcohol dehydrogenase family protein [Solirubrobacterales bacterium]